MVLIFVSPLNITTESGYFFFNSDTNLIDAINSLTSFSPCVAQL
ncbi:hypothetical protein NW063_01100 [Mycoplasmopsis cynos]|nr:hypothetical protein [Mycoplasmopsis cynos]UWV86339.1 hypothetical protein NW063_01100 [Mycoplasmopsis cynos]